MKLLGTLALIGVIASPASPLRAQSAPTLATDKSVAQFGTCFAAEQDRALMAWSYVPKPRGGTFSNLGARGAPNAYFLTVSDRGTVRALRLEPAGTAAVDPDVAHAVNQCA